MIKYTVINKQIKEMNMFDNMFNGIMGKITAGYCRLSYNGRIAVKTSTGYKTYNEKTGNLTDCSNFVVDIADDFFMLMPTRKLKVGDIVMINGKPMYVLEVKGKNRVEVMSYEDASIKTVIPERHALLGRKFYGKIVSLIGSGFMSKSKGGFFKNMLKFKMMSSMLGGNSSSSNNSFGGLSNSSLPMLMLMSGGSMDGLFDGICEDDDDDDSSDAFSGIFGDDEEEDDDEEVVVKKATKKVAKKAK